MRSRRLLGNPVLWVGLLFAALLLRMDALRPLLERAFPGVEPVIYNRDSFLALFLSQLVLAIAVPMVGFGARPTVIALFLYGLLPIIENAIAGLEGVPHGVREAAEGMGLSGWQRLYQVDLPLAAPVILAGIRVSVTIAIGTATIGSTVGALTLGTPIFDGLVANKLPFVLEGAVLVALFAILTDLLFARLERSLRPAAA